MRIITITTNAVYGVYVPCTNYVHNFLVSVNWRGSVFGETFIFITWSAGAVSVMQHVGVSALAH